MIRVVTLGETMAVFTPAISEPLRYVTDYHMRIAGAESNLAIGLQKIGHATGWISRLGDDEFGHFILNRIRSEGVDTSLVAMDDRYKSGLMFKEINTVNETRVYYYRDNSAASHLAPDDIDEEYIAQAQILHLTGITPILSASCLAAVRKAVEVAKRHHVLISFDPNIRLKLWNGKDYTSLLLELLKQADIVTLGVGESKKLLGTSEIREIYCRLLENSHISYLAIKDGAKGAWVGTREKLINVPPTKWEKVDAVGAGDAFNAGFIAGILEKQPVEICGKMANIMGGLATQSIGDTEGLPSRNTLRAYLLNEEIIYR